jgi:hypothetical protein
MKKIILLAATIYFLIAPITYHPDTKLVLYYATLGNKKVWNIYKYLNDNIDSAPKFHYPPINYFVTKIELPIVKFVGGVNIVEWLGSKNNTAFMDSDIFLYNLASKFPLIILILIAGIFIYKIVIKTGYSENIARLAAIIWYLNPITLYSGVMMGQNDILAVLPFIIGLYYYYDYPIIAFLLFGFASSIKSFPLVWAIALAGVYPTKNWFKKIGLFLIPVLFYGLTLFPFLKYDYFVHDVINSGLALRMFEMSVLIFGIKVSVVPVLLVVTTLVGIKYDIGKNYIGLCKLLVAINFVILGFSNFNPQWFIWIMPFFSIILAITGGWWILLFTSVLLVGVTLLIDDKFLYWGIISPINPSLINLPYFSEIFRLLSINVVKFNNLLRLFISFLSIYWIYVCAKVKK